MLNPELTSEPEDDNPYEDDDEYEEINLGKKTGKLDFELDDEENDEFEADEPKHINQFRIKQDTDE